MTQSLSGVAAKTPPSVSPDVAASVSEQRRAGVFTGQRVVRIPAQRAPEGAHLAGKATRVCCGSFGRSTRTDAA